MDALFRAGLQNACWAAALALAAFVGTHLWRRRPAVAHALWLLVLLKLLIPSLVSVELARAQKNHVAEMAPTPGAQLRERQPDGEPGFDGARTDLREFRTASSVLTAPPRETQRAERALARARFLPWKPLAVGFWFFGVTVCWSIVALGSYRFRRLLRAARVAPAALACQVTRVAARLGLKEIPRLELVPARIAPMVWASLAGRPRLLLPEELWQRLSATQQDAVLVHELAHLKRRDHWVRRLETIVLGLYWWFPIAWWARRELEQAEEKCCDVWVLWAIPGAAGAYADALVATAAFLSGQRQMIPAGATGTCRTLPIRRRLNMILDDASPGSLVRTAPRALVVLGLVMLPLLPALALGQAPAAPEKAAPRSIPAENEKAKLPPRRAQEPIAKPAPASSPDVTSENHPPAVKVRVCQAIEREVSDYADFQGPLEAAQTVQLKARVSGYLVNVHYRAGQSVQRGALLFQIDPRSYEAEKEKAAAELQRAEARRKWSAKELVRTRELFQRNVVGQSKISELEIGLEEAEAGVKAATAALALAQLNLEYTRMTAPLAGSVGVPHVAPGDVVIADHTTLAHLTSVDPLYVSFGVDEATLLRLARMKREGKMKQGLELDVPVRVGLQDEAGFPRSGKIEFVDRRLTSGLISCRASVANSDGLLLPGMFARVRLQTGPPHQAVLIPEATLNPDRMLLRGRGNYVLVVTPESVVQVRRITPGLAYGHGLVVPDGIMAGEWLILGNVNGGELVGRPVFPERVPWPGPALSF